MPSPTPPPDSTTPQDLHARLLESPAIAADPQFGPVWTEMPCGKTAIPGEAKH